MKRYFLFFLLPAITACSALSKSQRKAVDEFAESSREFALAPKQFLDGANQCLFKFGQLEAVSSDNDSVRRNKLNNSFLAYAKWNDFIEAYTTTHQLIGKYGTALQRLANVNVEKEVRENAATLGTAIDTLIKKSKDRRINILPIGFGKLAAKLLQLAGNGLIKKKQRDSLIAFLEKGDSLVASLDMVLDDLVSPVLVKGKLEEIDKGVENVYRNFLRLADSSEQDVISRYEKWNARYLELKACSQSGLLFLTKLKVVSTKFREAHATLLEKIKIRDNSMLWTELASFTKEANELFQLANDYRKSFTP